MAIGLQRTRVIRPYPPKIFRTREEAERARDRLNLKLPVHGSSWFMGEHRADEWWVFLGRDVAAELSTPVEVFEEAFRSALEVHFSDRETWRRLEGIEVESVSRDGNYPETTIAVVFRPVPNHELGTRQFGCRFGYCVPIWPAEDPDPEGEARAWTMYFMEFLDTDGRAHPIWHGPCDPDEVTWLLS